MARLSSYIISMIILLAGSILLISPSFTFSQQATARGILDNMHKEIGEIKTLRFTLHKKERVKGIVLSGEQNCKYQRSPKKIYTKIIAPNKGVELLYLEGSNGNKVLLNPNGFPYMNLTLDTYSSTLRNNNHHTIHEVGFDYINGIISYMTQQSGTSFDKYFRYTGDTVVNGRKCYKILIDYTPFAIVNYKVRANETVTDIAYRLYISDFMVLELNPDIDDYDDVEAGQIIKIPSAYARKTLLYIDQQNYLPILQTMYDGKGFFSQYEFVNLQVNPVIPAEEFDRNYKDYDF